MEIPQKIKHRTTIATGNSAFGYLLKENKNTNWKKNIQVHLCSLAEKTMVRLMEINHKRDLLQRDTMEIII